jgi:hypothetical protein
MAKHLLEVTLALALAGCGGTPAQQLDASVPDMTCTEPVYCCTDDQVGDAGVAPSWRNVELIFDGSCAMGMCHYPGYIPNGLDLTHGHAYANIVNQTPKDTANLCGGIIVKPGHPEQSYLMVKLTAPNDPNCGQPIPPSVSGLPAGTMQCNPKNLLMPIGEPFSCPLANCKLDLFRRWILEGAPPQ